MNPTYFVLALSLPEAQHEMAVALLADIGYEGFEEKPDELLAYIDQAVYNAEQLAQRLGMLGITTPPEPIPLEDINWNHAWEKAYDPVYVGRFCQIIAPFHTPQDGFAHTLHLSPKMAFGTGHHATTYLMVQAMEQVDFTGKTILDMGCGTGILGILSRILGAQSVVGIDIDHWSYENATVNAQLNGVEGIRWMQGAVEAIPEGAYDCILANINRNVLLADIPAYVSHLLPGGKLLLSGYYVEDHPAIHAKCSQAGLSLVSTSERNRWEQATYTR